MQTTVIGPDAKGSIKKFIRKFSKAADVYIACFDSECNRVADFSEEPEVNLALGQYITEELIEELYLRVVLSEVENQVIDNTDNDYIKVAACSVSVGGICRLFYVICCVQEGAVLSDEDAKYLKRYTSFERFLDTLDVVRVTTQDILEARMNMYRADEMTKRTEGEARELEEALRAKDAITRVLSLLDSTQRTAYVMAEFLDVTARYLGVSHAVIYNLPNIEQRTMDVPAQWNAKGYPEIYSRTHNQKLPAYIDGVKPVIISSNSKLLNDEARMLENVTVSAVAAIPLPLIDGSNMYAVYIESVNERNWKLDELQFLTDCAKILTSILDRRVQKNSIASSYFSLEEILEHVGSAIIVIDIRKHEILFRNRLAIDTFPIDALNPELNRLFGKEFEDSAEFEFYDKNSDYFFDVMHNYITWVDGRRVSLFAFNNVTDKKNYQKKIEMQAYTDFLTGLSNRMCCERDLTQILDRLEEKGGRGAVLYMDLDNFKHINDSMGHQWGDILLKEFGSRIKAVRGIENYCYRMGGDEFVIIITPDNFINIKRIVKDVRNVFAVPYVLKDGDYYSTTSLGMTVFPDEAVVYDEIIKQADAAMYRAKKSGKNRLALGDVAKTFFNENEQ